MSRLVERGWQSKSFARKIGEPLGQSNRREVAVMGLGSVAAGKRRFWKLLRLVRHRG